MSPTDPDTTGQSQSSSDGATSGKPPADRQPRRSWRARLKLLGVAVVVLGILATGGMVGANYWTSRPEFCGTCHVMGTYYRSWSRDLHGIKTSARCVDCHYAPGEQNTLHAKFKGLSQMTSYFSGRYGQSRPRAHVSDASCLRTGCHADKAFMPKELLIGEPRIEKRVVGTQETEVKRNPTVHFVHQKHLQIESKLAENEAQLQAVRDRLQQAVSPEAYQEIVALTVSVTPAAARETELNALLAKLQLEPVLPDALEMMRLEHLRTRLRQLTGLTCAACHSYDASGQHHLMPADLQTCFTCHFTHQAFNRDTGECLKCHEPPTRQILIHDEVVDLSFKQPGVPSAATTQPVLMDHRDIVNRKIDCVSCHFDVIQGDATVSARDCTHCHDQQQYLEEFESRTVETVAKYHLKHVAAQTAHCFDCHRTVQHQLIDPVHVATSPQFLQPVINDCQHCHPGHHREQMEMFMGAGGTGVNRSMPNAMFGSRINCQACHTKKAVDLKGDELIKATEATCIACHGQDYERLFQQWQNEIDSYLKEAEATLARVDDRIKELQAKGEEVPASLTYAVEDARSNLKFVRSANGIHNKNYALELMDVSIRKLDEVMTTLLPK